ncbi:MAG: hypothetical protein DLM68_06570 [Hyphomicrobiales bacterium]|nr:MAG: hypothetical protein DLM68_06570 [Hyphomicrobiales bacterium]
MRGAAKAEWHPMSGTLAKRPSPVRKNRSIASLASGSSLSRTKVYYPAHATGLEQILLGIAYGLR